MTERDQENIEVPERAHDQPAEGGRDQAKQAEERTAAGSDPSSESPAEKVE